jgi:predicted naringenin-chalcone synthase
MAVSYKAFRPDRAANRIKIEYLEAQERDHWVHQLNKARYEAMLPGLAVGPFRTRVQQLLAETDSRLEEVEAIILATHATLPAQSVVDEVVAELALEREAEKLARRTVK